MPFLILSVIIQVAFVLHIVKTGRNTTWIWIVIMLPLAGSIAYFILEVMPDLANTKAGRKTVRNVSHAMDPNKALREATHNYQKANTIENTLNLANALLAKGSAGEAKPFFEQCLKGIHAQDPEILLGLAKAEFGLQNHPRAQELLDELIQANPDYRNPDAHLLYARSLAAQQKATEALHEFEALHQYFSGPEADYYYGCLCKQQGDNKKAQQLFSGILEQGKRSGKQYTEFHRHWLTKANTALKTLRH